MPLSTPNVLKCKVFNKGSRPVSRVLSKATIHLGCASPHTSSDLPESGADHAHGFLFGLAPGGVYPAALVTGNAVRSYRTISPLPSNKAWPRCLAVYFLWHCPSTRAAQALPGTLSYGARTFLRPAPPQTLNGVQQTSGPRLPGRLQVAT